VTPVDPLSSRRNKKSVVGVAETVSVEGEMRGMLLWFLGIPIPVIILLYLFHVI
jgi:hypothetical protein